MSLSFTSGGPLSECAVQCHCAFDPSFLLFVFAIAFRPSLLFLASPVSLQTVIVREHTIPGVPSPFLQGILLENLRKPRENGYFLKRPMIQKNGQSTSRNIYGSQGLGSVSQTRNGALLYATGDRGMTVVELLPDSTAAGRRQGNRPFKRTHTHTHHFHKGAYATLTGLYMGGCIHTKWP